MTALLGWKTAVAAGWLILLYVIEGQAPRFPGRRGRAGHDLRNLALGVVNAAVGALLVAFGVRHVAESAQRAGLGLVNWVALPAWGRPVAAFVLFDAWMYLWHRWNHRVRFLWRFHSVHHADAELDASSAVRFHTGEIVLSSAARLAVLPLLGMTVPQLLLYETVLLPVILFHHSNIRIPGRLDRLLRLVTVTPWMHWVHHSQRRPETDSNYSSVFSIWDRIFRTFRLRRRPGEIVLGLGYLAEADWRSLPATLAIPFRPLRRTTGPRRESI